MTFTSKGIEKELSRIMGSIPDSFREGLITEQKMTPTVEMVMKEAVKMEEIPQEKRDQIQHLLDAGEFSKMKLVENEKRAKIIDEYVMREIRKSVKAGRLPNRKQLKDIPDFKDFYEKIIRSSVSQGADKNT